MTWKSWHLHLTSSAREMCDRMVTDVVGPVVAGLPEPTWFFVRYWQGGPHLRLRIRDLDADQAAGVGAELVRDLAVVGRRRDDEEPFDLDGFAALAERLAAAGEGGVTLTAQQLVTPGVHPAVYEPEYERYGGVELLPVSEKLFCTSSELCLAFLRTQPSRNVRSSLALQATASAAAALGLPQFPAYAAKSWQRWAREFGYPASTLDQLDADCAQAATQLRGRSLITDSGARLLRGWQAALSSAVERWEQPARIAFSHVHMLHNRLGLTTLEELRSYSLLAQCGAGQTEIHQHLISGSTR